MAQFVDVVVRGLVLRCAGRWRPVSSHGRCIFPRCQHLETAVCRNNANSNDCSNASRPSERDDEFPKPHHGAPELTFARPSFANPFLNQATDLTRQSLPLSYFSVAAASVDGSPHSVKVYSDISAGACLCSSIIGNITICGYRMNYRR